MKTFGKIMYYFLRIITLPCIIGIQVVFSVAELCINCYRWVWFGGELLAYRRDERKSITDVYIKVCELVKIKEGDNEP